MSGMQMPRRRKGRGTLHVVAGLLVASALIRGGNQGMIVYAETATSALDPEVAAPVEAAMEPMEQAEMTDAEVSTLLVAFRAREERLAMREAQLADRLQAMRVAEEQIAGQLEALTTAEAKLAATLALAETATENDLNRLAIVYQNMKPRDTAALFTQMAPGFAAGFLGLMQPEAAAAIMTELEPDVAYSISVMLAGRNANAPTQ